MNHSLSNQIHTQFGRTKILNNTPYIIKINDMFKETDITSFFFFDYVVNDLYNFILKWII